VVTDSRNARDGRFIETLGTYNPISNPAKVQVNQTKTFYWLGEGAQMTGTVEKIFEKSGVLSRYKTGEELREEEEKITVEIFGHDLDEHGSKRKGKRKQAASMTEEAEAAEAAAEIESTGEAGEEETSPEVKEVTPVDDAGEAGKEE